MQPLFLADKLRRGPRAGAQGARAHISRESRSAGIASECTHGKLRKICPTSTREHLRRAKKFKAGEGLRPFVNDPAIAWLSCRDRILVRWQHARARCETMLLASTEEDHTARCGC